MSNDHDVKAAEGQQKGDGFPGDGAIEWTGEPLPADVVAAASAAAEAVAAATAASVAAGSTGSRGGHRAAQPATPAPATPPAPAVTPATPVAPAPAAPATAPAAAPAMLPVAPPVVTSVAPVPPAPAVPAAAADAGLGTDPVRPGGSAAIGGYRPWAAALDPMPEPKRTLPSRRLMILAGTIALVVTLVAAILLSGLAGGGSHNTGLANPTQGGVSAASAQDTTNAMATDSTNANESASPSAAAASPTAATSPSAAGPASLAGPVTASTVLAADRGAVVSSDNFKNSHSGWSLPKANTAVTTYKYTSTGYAIGSLTGTLEHMVYAPYKTAKQQLSMSVTATQSGAPKGAGFGVTCRRGTDGAEISYTMVVLNNGTYYMERYSGVPTATSSPKILKRGSSSVSAGSAPVTVVGMCATISPGVTRVALFANDQLLADVTDTATLAGSGWAGGIDMASFKTASTLLVTSWQERDLSK
jgi:hypothetical protein